MNEKTQLKSVLVALLVLVTFVAVLINLIYWKHKDIFMNNNGGYSLILEIDQKSLKQTIIEDAEAKGKTLSEEEIAFKMELAMSSASETAVEVVRNRTKAFGTKEPVISRDDNGRIYVQILDVTETNQQQAKELICCIGNLKFSLVSPSSGQKVAKLLADGKAPRGYKLSHDEYGNACYVRDSDSQVDYTDSEYTTYLRKFGNPKPGTQFMLQKVTGKNGMDYYYPIFVKRKAELTGENLERAKTDIDPTTGERYVSLTFDSEGRKKFADITGRNINKRLAIILDDVVYSAPVILTRIDGEPTITGNFSFEEARQLQTVLNAGSLSAPLIIVDETYVQPKGDSTIINKIIKTLVP